MAAERGPVGQQRGARAGYALVATMVVLMLVGTVVTIGFYNAPTPRPQHGTPAEQAATAMAETGVHKVLATWGTEKLQRLPASGDTTIIGHGAALDTAVYVVSIGRSGPAQFTITSTGVAGGAEGMTYCTLVMRTRLKSGRLAERGAAVDRTCRDVP